MQFDLIIAYGLLNQAANDIKGLSPESSRIQNTAKAEGRGIALTVPGQVNENNPDLGPSRNLYRALGTFFDHWASPMSNAMDGLDKLAGYFQGVADTFEEADASQAAAMTEGAMMSAILRYPQQMDLYTQELENEVDPNGKLVGSDPTPPTPVPNPFSLPGVTGATTTYTMGGQDPYSPPGVKSSSWPNDLVTSETTTVTGDGMTYSETTTFGPDQGWGPNGPTQDTTQVVTNPDGSTDTITTTSDTSGKGNMSELDSTSGKTSTYTRADWNSSWVDTTPKPGTGDGDPDPDSTAPYHGPYW
ncbi:MAG TPA: hypothetical protein VGX23_12280 [Actinocrinis sp.]|nr:hypothetical protein [Actinocrinis sp.]